MSQPFPTTYLPDDIGFTLLPPVEPVAPDDLATPMRAGDAAFRAGEYAEARRHYVRAQLDGVYAGEAAIAYALVHFAEGDYTLAGMALRRGLTELPNAIQQPIDVVWLYGQSDLLEQHLKSLTGHLADDPADIAGWFVLGYVRFAAGDPAGAVEAFDRAVALYPGDVHSHLVREAAVAVLRSWPASAAAASSAPSGGP